MPLSEAKSGIYQIQNQADGKCYIGSARNVRFRLRAHLRMLCRGAHHNRHLQRAFDLHGESQFVVIVLEEVEDVEQLVTREQYYLDALKPEYNFCPIAYSALGFHHSAKARVRISETHKGDGNAFFGKHHSDKTRTQMSRAHMGERNSMYGLHGEANPNYGRRHTEETRRKISEALKGHCHSEETKQKIGKANRGNQNHLGRPNSEETRRKISEAWTPERRQRASDWMRQLNKRRASCQT